MVERYGVAPGTNGVVFTNNDDAYLTAFALKSGRCECARGRFTGSRPMATL